MEHVKQYEVKMKTIKLLERYCKNCNKYVDIFTKRDNKGNERCLTCMSKLTYEKAIYKRIDSVVVVE